MSAQIMTPTETERPSEHEIVSRGEWLIARNVTGWIIPGAILTLIPKCPMCLAAYVAVWTGIGVSLSTAAHLRMSLLVLSLGLILFLAAINTARLIRKFG